MAPIQKKLVIVGDGVLLIVFSKDQFPEGYAPAGFQNYVARMEVDGKRVENGHQKSSISVSTCPPSWCGPRRILGMMYTQNRS
uniref:Uncharacterized protein n=1 Tax=Piliocolobus tephrosceles TaxID=591936 RepID=A0A8C9GY16_9PRIM